MKFVKFFSALSFLLFQTAHGAAVKSTSKQCTFSLDRGKEKLTFTGYKFPSKFGVKGTFNLINVEAKDNAASLDELIRGVRWSIATESLDTQDPVRNLKIHSALMGPFKNPFSSTGYVKTFDLKKKQFVAAITLGGKEAAVDFKLTGFKDNYIKLEGELDLIKHFGMTEGLNRLHEACKLLHTQNGVSKTWPTVDLMVEASYIKTCK